MNLKEICKRLSIIENRMFEDVRDNMKIQSMHLIMFGDGSGEIQADWSNFRKDMCKEEYLLNAIFTREGPIFRFSDVEELEEWLERQAPSEAPPEPPVTYDAMIELFEGAAKRALAKMKDSGEVFDLVKQDGIWRGSLLDTIRWLVAREKDRQAGNQDTKPEDPYDPDFPNNLAGGDR